MLRYWAGLSEREIAETLGISTGSVKSAASRGMAALHRILGAPVMTRRRAVERAARRRLRREGPLGRRRRPGASARSSCGSTDSAPPSGRPAAAPAVLAPLAAAAAVVLAVGLSSRCADRVHGNGHAAGGPARTPSGVARRHRRRPTPTPTHRRRR